VQVVQEYERAVIFRLGRLLSGGTKGPGRLAASGHIFKYSLYMRWQWRHSIHNSYRRHVEGIPCCSCVMSKTQVCSQTVVRGIIHKSKCTV